MSTQDCSARGKYCVFGKSTEESAANSADWIREETEELVSEEDIETAGGAGEVRMMVTVTAGELEGSGVKNGKLGAVAGRGNTWEVTSKEIGAAGAGGRNDAENR